MQGKSENLNVQKIKHRMPSYDLRVTYKSGIKDSADGHNQSLEIYLKTNSGSVIQSYKLFYTDLTIPEEIINAFSEMEIVFQCFRDQTGFNIDLKTGNILIQTQFEVKSRKINRKYLLILEKHEATEFQVMFQQIKQLQEQVNKLKQNKEVRDEQFRKKYQEKYEEEKRKFDLTLKEKEQELIKQKRIQQQLQKSIQNLRKQMEDLSQRMKNFDQTNLCSLKELKDKTIVCQKQIKKTRDELDDVLLFKQGILRKKTFKNDNIQNTRPNKNQMAESTIMPSKPVQLQKHKKLTNPSEINDEGPSFVYGKTPFLNKFSIKQNQITYIGEEKQTQLLFKPAIPQTPFSFEVTILKTAERAIMIGIVDINESLKHRHSDKKSASYWGKTGYIWGPGKFQGEGFSQGDTVRVTVDMGRNIVQWRVNGELAASWKPDFFEPKTRLIVPFIEMQHPGDTIRWNNI